MNQNRTVGVGVDQADAVAAGVEQFEGDAGHAGITLIESIVVDVFELVPVDRAGDVVAVGECGGVDDGRLEGDELLGDGPFGGVDVAVVLTVLVRQIHVHDVSTGFVDIFLPALNREGAGRGGVGVFTQRTGEDSTAGVVGVGRTLGLTGGLSPLGAGQVFADDVLTRIEVGEPEASVAVARLTAEVLPVVDDERIGRRRIDRGSADPAIEVEFDVGLVRLTRILGPTAVEVVELVAVDRTGDVVAPHQFTADDHFGLGRAGWQHGCAGFPGVLLTAEQVDHKVVAAAAAETLVVVGDPVAEDVLGRVGRIDFTNRVGLAWQQIREPERPVGVGDLGVENVAAAIKQHEGDAFHGRVVGVEAIVVEVFELVAVERPEQVIAVGECGGIDDGRLEGDELLGGGCSAASMLPSPLRSMYITWPFSSWTYSTTALDQERPGRAGVGILTQSTGQDTATGVVRIGRTLGLTGGLDVLGAGEIFADHVLTRIEVGEPEPSVAVAVLALDVLPVVDHERIGRRRIDRGAADPAIEVELDIGQGWFAFVQLRVGVQVVELVAVDGTGDVVPPDQLAADDDFAAERAFGEHREAVVRARIPDHWRS